MLCCWRGWRQKIDHLFGWCAWIRTVFSMLRLKIGIGVGVSIGSGNLHAFDTGGEF
jgi:hypothetical protein